MLEQTDEIEGHLKDSMETQSSGNFIKYKKLILTMSLNNGVFGCLMIHHLSSYDDSSAKTRFHVLELLAKRVPWKNPRTQAFEKAFSCLLQTDRSVLLLKITGTYIESSLLCSSIYGAGRYSVDCQKRNANGNLS